MKKVILTATATGAIFTQSLDANNNPKLDKNGKEFGFIRVENPAKINLGFAYNGPVNRGTSALIAMTVEAWEKSKAHFKANMEIDGNVVITESTTQLVGMQPKLSGKNGIQLTINGQPIYRGTQFDASGKVEDVLIAHDNVAEVKAAQAALATAETLN